MTITFVGALNVGSISLHFDPDIKTNMRAPYKSAYSWKKDYTRSEVARDVEMASKLDKDWNATEGEEEVKLKSVRGVYIKKGTEMGMFNFGSTIVLIFTAPKGLSFNFKEGEKLKVGQVIFPSK